MTHLPEVPVELTRHQGHRETDFLTAHSCASRSLLDTSQQGKDPTVGGRLHSSHTLSFPGKRAW